MNILNDEWKTGGTDIAQFLEETKKLEERTSIREMRCKDLILYTTMDENPSEWKFRVNFSGASPGEGKLPKSYFASANPELTEELVSSIQVARGAVGFRAKNKKGVVVNHLLPYSDAYFMTSLCAKCGVKGTPFHNPTTQRDAFLASIFDSTKAKLIIREAEGHQKVFAVRGRDFTPIPQNQTFQEVFEYIENEMGEYKSEEWTVGNDFSKIILSLPEQEKEIAAVYPEIKDDISPRVLVSTSDIGLSSFCVWAVFKTRSGYVSPKKFRVYAEHTKSFSKEKLFSDIKKKVFANYTSYPEAFAKLLTIDVNVSNAVDEVMSYCGINKPGLQKTGKAIAELVKEELGEDETVTAYEVVMSIINAPARVVDNKGEPLPKSTIDALAEAFAGAPFCDFKKSYVLLPE